MTEVIIACFSHRYVVTNTNMAVIHVTVKKETPCSPRGERLQMQTCICFLFDEKSGPIMNIIYWGGCMLTKRIYAIWTMIHLVLRYKTEKKKEKCTKKTNADAAPTPKSYSGNHWAQTTDHREDCKCSSWSLLEILQPFRFRVHHTVFSPSTTPWILLRQCEKSFISTADETFQLNASFTHWRGFSHSVIILLVSCFIQMCLTRGPC